MWNNFPDPLCLNQDIYFIIIHLNNGFAPQSIDVFYSGDIAQDSKDGLLRLPPALFFPLSHSVVTGMWRSAIHHNSPIVRYATVFNISCLAQAFREDAIQQHKHNRVEMDSR